MSKTPSPLTGEGWGEGKENETQPIGPPSP
jgi:hypothetical protein